MSISHADWRGKSHERNKTHVPGRLCVLTKDEQLQTNKNRGRGCRHELFIIGGISFPEGPSHPSKARLIPPESAALCQRKPIETNSVLSPVTILDRVSFNLPIHLARLRPQPAFPTAPHLPTCYLIRLMFCKIRKSPSAVAVMRAHSQDAR